MAAVHWLLRQYCGSLVRRSETRCNFRDIHSDSDYCIACQCSSHYWETNRQKKSLVNEGRGVVFLLWCILVGDSIALTLRVHCIRMKCQIFWDGIPPSGIFAVLIMSRAPDTDNSTSNHIEYMLFNIVYVPASNRYSVLVCVYWVYRTE